jgi:hypothetical protein
MKYLSQVRASALGRLIGALPFVAVVVYMLAKLAALASSLGV